MKLLIALIVCVAISGCISPPRAITNPDGVAIERDFTYAQVGDRELKLDVYRPESQSEVLPAVLWIHGGGWVMGTKDWSPIAPFAVEDVVMISVEYRLLGEAAWPAQLHDVKAAIRYVRANADDLGIDPDRIALWGVSAGGHLASMAGVTADVPYMEGNVGITGISSHVNAVVAYCAPLDLAGLYEEDVDWRMYYAIRRLLDGNPTERPYRALTASPKRYLSSADAPHVFIHGSNDSYIPTSQSADLAQALSDHDVATQVHVVDGAGHGNWLIANEQGRHVVQAFLQEQGILK